MVPLQILKASLIYFAMVFGAGFVLGPVREFWLVPRVGVRTAELLEMPIMLAVIVLASRWIARRSALLSGWPRRLSAGGLALLFMLVAEFSLVLWLRGVTLTDYFATRDPVSATAYYLMLGVFAVMPLVWGRR